MADAPPPVPGPAPLPATTGPPADAAAAATQAAADADSAIAHRTRLALARAAAAAKQQQQQQEQQQQQQQQHAAAPPPGQVPFPPASVGADRSLMPPPSAVPAARRSTRSTRARHDAAATAVPGLAGVAVPMPPPPQGPPVPHHPYHLRQRPTPVPSSPLATVTAPAIRTARAPRTKARSPSAHHGVAMPTGPAGPPSAAGLTWGLPPQANVGEVQPHPYLRPKPHRKRVPAPTTANVPMLPPHGTVSPVPPTVSTAFAVPSVHAGAVSIPVTTSMPLTAPPTPVAAGFGPAAVPNGNPSLTVPAPAPMSPGTPSPVPPQSQSQQQQPSAAPATTNRRASLYKTELCRSYEETGACRYGPKCQFAHSPMELRAVHRHPKYKTEICRTFHEQGWCPYGRRCCFIHNDPNSGGKTALRTLVLAKSASPAGSNAPNAPVTPTANGGGARFAPQQAQGQQGQQLPTSPFANALFSPTAAAAARTLATPDRSPLYGTDLFGRAVGDPAGPLGLALAAAAAMSDPDGMDVDDDMPMDVDLDSSLKHELGIDDLDVASAPATPAHTSASGTPVAPSPAWWSPHHAAAATAHASPVGAGASASTAPGWSVWSAPAPGAPPAGATAPFPTNSTGFATVPYLPSPLVEPGLTSSATHSRQSTPPSTAMPLGGASSLFIVPTAPASPSPFHVPGPTPAPVVMGGAQAPMYPSPSSAARAWAAAGQPAHLACAPVASPAPAPSTPHAAVAAANAVAWGVGGAPVAVDAGARRRLF
ncbi:hypothetical protein AMAG_15989 [Allomyces macrogynus ATCC 38327]|uniref:C3H1-type domain-containing protein n=1 Tax=Allomyces macrogynus (strain ATCC 38327) TaxID=578462 RepID=A0A0L0TB77_ALLM3|nr:hypothetical protein AMAG_15989 [Allomyces macrogynus ATCC 38327]|eukprot:KNE72048.1 hypothetical protein AMAG_15989 [Allomyces macrogynus ATCC 38327]